MKKYDSIIIGSSPVSILEAIYRAEQNDRVLLVEKAPGLGGAWRTEPCFGLRGVEVSPHVMLPNRYAYRIISEKLGVAMKPMLPPPVYIINGRKRKLQYLNAERVYREIATLKGRVGYVQKSVRLLASIYHAIKLSASKYRSEILYPEGGLNKLLQHAEKTLVDLGVDIVLNQEVVDISYHSMKYLEPGYTITTRTGEQYLSSKMASSAIIALETIHIDDRLIKPYSFISQSDHVTYLMKSGNRNGYGFAKFIDDGFFELVSDVSDFTPDLQDKYPGCRIVTCRFRKSKLFEPDQVPGYFDHLMQNGYLSGTESIVESYYYCVEDSILAGYVIDRLNTLFENTYEFIGSRDLGMTDSLDEFNSRWEFVFQD